MAAWRPLARDFDIFLGLEAATDRGLAGIDKDAGVNDSIEAVRVARELKYGINGNFLIDHDWSADDFRELWDFVARHNLQRAGFTILTPLPGTDFYREMAPRMQDQPWSNFDMHHLLWEPRLGVERFFELYAGEPGAAPSLTPRGIKAFSTGCARSAPPRSLTSSAFSGAPRG